MNDRDNARYEMGCRVVAFGKDCAIDFDSAGKAVEHFGKVKQILDKLDKARAGQKGLSVASKATLVDSLRLDVQNIARTAAALDMEEPGFADKFPFPKSNERSVVETADLHLKSLRVTNADESDVIAAKEALAQKFIAHELPGDFVQHLFDDREAVSNVKETLEQSREGGVENTKFIAQLIAELMKEVSFLDAMMHNKYSRNPERLRAWKSASHVERPPRKKADKPQTPPASGGN